MQLGSEQPLAKSIVTLAKGERDEQVGYNGMQQASKALVS